MYYFTILQVTSLTESLWANIKALGENRGASRRECICFVAFLPSRGCFYSLIFSSPPFTGGQGWGRKFQPSNHLVFLTSAPLEAIQGPHLKSPQYHKLRCDGKGLVMSSKIQSLPGSIFYILQGEYTREYINHSGNHKGFRSSVPGTWEKNKMYVLLLHHGITHILSLYSLSELEYFSHWRYSEVHYFLVFLVIIYCEVIFLGTLPVRFPERIYFCLYREPGALK